MTRTNFKAKRTRVGIALVVSVLTAGSILPLAVQGSSHREAPLITGDPKADATDLYAFVAKDKPDAVTLIANYVPSEDPDGGPNFYQFDENVLYEIHIDNNGDAQPDVTYQYRFKTATANPKTFLYNTGPIKSLDDPNLNVRQSYSLTKVQNGQPTVIAENVPTPPSNVGEKSTPDYASLQQQAVKSVGGLTTFAGQSADPFFVNLGGIFDLLSVKSPDDKSPAPNSLKDKSVQSIALQVPIAEVTASKAKPADPKDPNGVIGVWTTASRQATTVLSGNGTVNTAGSFVQVSRLGNPLVNEVVTPRGAKDLFNSSKPADDAQFAEAVANPELGGLLNKLYNVKVPPQGAFGSPQQRDDLEAIYLTGIPDLTKPANGKPAEELRLNVAVPPTQNPDRLGVLAKDTQGFPNGRRLNDDVVDISLQAVGGAAYPLFHKDFQPDPMATTLSDGVDSPAKAPRESFPYLALPNAGTDVDTKEGKVRGSTSSSEEDDGTSRGTVVVIALLALLVGAGVAYAAKSGSTKQS